MKTVIIDACRTPIGKFGGSLAGETAIDLGKVCLNNLLARVDKKISPELASSGEKNLLKRKPYFQEVYPGKKDQSDSKSSSSAALVEEVIIGNVLSAGLGQNPARQIIIPSLSRRVPASTLNQVCGSGMKAVILADYLITAGVNTIMVAGGTESMSGAPYLFSRGKKSGLGSMEMEDSIIRDGLTDAFHNYPMGITAENLARDWKISREEQDEFAYYSQMKAAAAEKAGQFYQERPAYKNEKNEKSKTAAPLLDRDEFIRPDANLKKLSALSPVFDPKGSVTAGSASGVNDGASLLYLMEEKQAIAWGVKPLAAIKASVTVAIDETMMGYSPKIVIEELFRLTGLSWHDLASVEINEAFAVQTLAVLKDLGVSPAEYNQTAQSPVRVNPWGGAIALGHPIGCSGARILTTLSHTLHTLKSFKSDKHPLYGIAALCVGGGQGCGVMLEV